MKLFCVSDIHSSYTPLKNALDKANFNENDPNHLLIVCGDVFDRGHETLEVYEYLKNIKNKILIKGNHEYLYNELLEPDAYPSYGNFHNGTIDTFCQIAGYPTNALDRMASMYASDKDIKLWIDIKNKVKNSEITKWINSDEWKYYYEFGNFIFCHSCIALEILKTGDDLIDAYYQKAPIWKVPSKYIRIVPNWREKATDDDWFRALWVRPTTLIKDGVLTEDVLEGKTLVSGHINSVYYFNELDGIENPDSGHIYIGKNIICLDTHVFSTGKLHVLVIDEKEFLYTTE